MSSYLVTRIISAANIVVRYHSEVVAVHGEGHLEALTLADTETGVTEDVPSSWLFIFIGASPRTDWLGSDIVRDDKGFVVTGQDLLGPDSRPAVATRPAPIHTRDECAWGLRSRRRTAQLDETGRVGSR